MQNCNYSKRHFTLYAREFNQFSLTFKVLVPDLSEEEWISQFQAIKLFTATANIFKVIFQEKLVTDCCEYSR